MLLTASPIATVACSTNASSNDANDVDDSADANAEVANAVEAWLVTAPITNQKILIALLPIKKAKKIKEGEYIEKAMTNMMSALAGNERAAEERLLKEEEHKGKSQHMKKG